MNVAPGVEQAVELLKKERQAAIENLRSINAALRALGQDLVEVDAEERPSGSSASDRGFDLLHPDGTVIEVKTKRPPRRTKKTAHPSVRSVVQEILEGDDVGLTANQVIDLTREKLGDAVPEDRLRPNARTALWSLKQHDLVVENDGTFRATKWTPDAEPAPAGARAGSET